MDTQANFQNRVFSIDDAAEHLRVSRSFVYKLVADKQLRLTKFGRRSVVTGGEIARFIRAAEHAPPEESKPTRRGV